MSGPTLDRPTWEDYWAKVGSEDYLAAKALLELTPFHLDVDEWLEWRDGRPDLAWDAWVRDVEMTGRGWSSTESSLFQLVAALVANDERPIPLRRTLGYMGSWETDVWRILVEWGTGGNNRDAPGRATVISA